MKRFKFFLVAAFVLVAGTAMAQDSATVAITQQVLGYAENKWPIGAIVLSIWGAISEIMAIIPQKYLRANGVLDQIFKWGQAIIGAMRK